MKRFRSGATRSLIAAALATMMAGSAFGEEQLLMPYACRVQGGEVRLAPSADTFYRIYGARDKEVYTACSPDDPSRCRNWLVHRFDLDCGGTRVGWMKVAEAAARADRTGAWVDAGRMSLAMTPFWTIEREGPVFGRGWWRRSRFDRPYGDPDFIPRRRGGGIIVLPPGYAPVLSTGARFFEAPQLETARAAPAAEPPRAPEKQEPLPPPVKKSEVVAHAPTSVKESAAAGAGATSSATAPSADSASSSATVSPPGSTVTATIINKPGAAVPAAASPPPASVAEAQPKAPSADAKPSEPDQIATGSLQDGTTAADGGRTQLAVAGAATVALLLTGSLFLWSRRGRVHATDLARDPARVSLGGLGRSRGLALGRPDAGSVPGDPLPPATSPPANRPDEPLPMPTTVHEALAVIGASAGAAPEIVKKIVDGLRQSWHPDLARSEADRLYRERRMAQINVAWDILSGRQPEE